MTRLVFYWSARVNKSLKATHNPKVPGSNPAPATLDGEGVSGPLSTGADLLPLTENLSRTVIRKGRRRDV